jgi:hypothetical protein
MVIRIHFRTAAATAVLPLGLIAFTPQADAVTTAQGTVAAVQGRVIASALNVRSAPTTFARDVGTLRYRSTIGIQCKVYGQSVGGNGWWYKLSTGRWVTARYVANIGPAPVLCGDGGVHLGRIIASPSLTIRSGPNTANIRISSGSRGAVVDIKCKVDSQVIAGNPRWYELMDAEGAPQWASARYITNMDTAPPAC